MHLTSRTLQNLTINQLLTEQAEQNPYGIAITAPNRLPLSYRRLYTHIHDTAKTLNAMGLGRDDRIALVLPNGPEMAVAFLAVANCATCAPLNPAYLTSEFDFYLGDLNAKALIVQSEIDSPARAVAMARNIKIIELVSIQQAEAGIFQLVGDTKLPPIDKGFAQSEDVALVLHTSGTTSRPKIIPLSQVNLSVSVHNIKTALELCQSDRYLNVMPLFHVQGLISTIASIAAGASVICTPGFDASKFFAWLQAMQPTWYTAVPTVHQAVLAASVDHCDEFDHFTPLRFIRSAGAALPPKVLAALEELFSTVVIETYGMTETGSVISSNCLPPRLRKPGSVGIAAGLEVGIMNEMGHLLASGEIGEIVVRGDNVISEYENNPAANQNAFRNGWFRTGDQGYLDSDGYLFITGRLKEIINRGGKKISPREIDEVLLEHPKVAQAVSFAVPHPTLNEDVAAVVVLRQNVTINEREIREFAAAKLADFKIPSQVVFVDEIPKSSTGKIQRINLAQKLVTELTAPFVAPTTKVEKVLAEIWTEVLGVQQVGVYDNFFTLGGDSLSATQVISRLFAVLQVDIPLSKFFKAPTIMGLSEMLTQNQVVLQLGLQAISILPRTQNEDIPLSFAQQRLWFLDQFVPNTPTYNIPLAYRVTGQLNVKALEQSLCEIVRRHEVLRTTFRDVDGQPIQLISPEIDLRLRVVDLRETYKTELDAQVQRLATEEAKQPFDLTQGLLLRTKLLRLDEAEHVLLLVMHHIVSDGWSMGVLVRELAIVYQAVCNDLPIALPELPIQYADFAIWQREWFSGEALESNIAYWKKQLGGELPILELPTDRPRPPVQTYQGSRQSFELSKELTDALNVLSQQEKVTLFMTLLAAFKMLLYCYTGQEDVIVGSPIANRNRAEVEGLIGFFVNTLVLRSDLGGSPSFRELLSRVRKVALEAYDHQDMPFERMVEELQPERNLSYNPLFQVMFVFQNAPMPGWEFSELTLSPLEVDNKTTKLDLTLSLTETEQELIGTFTYNTDLFDDATIARMVGHLHTLLEEVIADPNKCICELPILTEAERYQLLMKCNRLVRNINLGKEK